MGAKGRGEVSPVFFIGVALLWSGLTIGCTQGAAGTKGSPAKSDAEEAGLIGRVKTVRLETAKFVGRGDGWAEGPRRFVSTTRYNENGNLAEEEFYRSTGLLTAKVIYTYDSRGRHAEQAVFKGDGSRPSKLVYHHDGSGLIVDKMIYNADGAFDWKVHFTYDGKGRKERVAVHDAEGALLSERVYLHDGDGNEVEERVYSADALVSRGVFSYDGKGNRIREIFYLPGGSVSAQYTYRYEFDEAGNWIKQIRSAIDIVSGEVVFRHSEVSYRTIVYD